MNIDSQPTDDGLIMKWQELEIFSLETGEPVRWADLTADQITRLAFQFEHMLVQVRNMKRGH